MVFLKFLWRVFREQKLRLMAVVFFMVVVAVMEGVSVALLVPLMNVIIGKEGTLPGILGNIGILIENTFRFLHIEPSLEALLALIVAVFVVQGLFRLWMRHLQGRMLARYEFSLIHRIFDSYFSSSWGFFIRSRAGQLANVLSVETHRAFIAFQTVCEFLAASLVAAFYIVLSFLISWPITLAGIVLCSGASLILKNFMERAHSYGLDISRVNEELQAYAFDTLATAKLLKSSATEEKVVDNMDALAERRVRLRYLSSINSALIPSIYQPLVMAILALIIYFTLVHLQVDFAVVLVFAYIFSRLSPYFSTLQLDYQQVLVNIPAVQEIDNTIALAASMAEVKGRTAINGLRRGIVFDDVSFAYQGGVPVLKNVNLEIKKGESVAIIGESGGGKTTLVDLLLGLFSPTQGRVLVDGIPLSRYDIPSWRKMVGYVSQDVFLFHNTIEANLRWMRPEATLEQVEAAARGAYAHEFILAMPTGYNTVVGDRGVKLSGGQRQRLALARMTLQNPEIIILDEPTSALDAESEARVQEVIGNLASDRTVIVISHRLSMLRNVERVYMLEAGKITEVEKGDELVSQLGRFKDDVKNPSI